MKTSVYHSEIQRWFASRGWEPFSFQEETAAHFQQGKDGMIHAGTGNGKTYAAWFSFINAYLMKEVPVVNELQVLWITPIRALVNDIENALKRPVEDMKLPITVASRTGDTSAHVKQKQKQQLPVCLVTTPESITIMLSDAAMQEKLMHLKLIVCDEWHELLSSKRGVMLELTLARLRKLNPGLRTWALTATIGNLNTALQVLTGPSETHAVIVTGLQSKTIHIETIIPDEIEKYPWGGHLGIKVLPQVIEKIDAANTTLLFTNTRSQTEIWYQSILSARPEWAGIMAVHHASLDMELRQFVEHGLKSGALKLVVCTSSLDLGVDFSPVEQVLQVGSPKGIARMLQRAGRSGHDPGRESVLWCVPTNAFELIEFAAVKHAIHHHCIEDRIPLEKPLDLLVQHILTIACGGGFEEHELFEEITSTYSYRNLTKDEWQWAMNFLTHGGESLQAYSEHTKIAKVGNRYFVVNKRVKRMHVMSIGIITSNPSMMVKYENGKNLGSIEEGFISRLNRGDCFVFAGKVVELIRIKEMQAIVKNAGGKKPTVPQWAGGRMPLSTQLSASVRQLIDDASQGILRGAEMQAMIPVLNAQQTYSEIPQCDELLIEHFESKEGFHTFIFPFEGRMVHEGLAYLLAYRVGRKTPVTFTIAINDYGLELLSDHDVFEDGIPVALFSTRALQEDILQSMNSGEMARRQFREIARISGLIFEGYPGQSISSKSKQASSGLFYDVFTQYEPGNMLLRQAYREVLDSQLEYSRLYDCLERMKLLKRKRVHLKKPSPFSFPIMVERITRTQLSSESLEEKIRKMTL